MELGFKADLFDPSTIGAVDKKLSLVTVHGNDGRPSYVYNRSIILAVNLARAARRPLFVAGRPGAGKTTLAASVAGVLGSKYYQKVVTSRTRAKDLMWTFDSLRRLSDAQERDKTLPPRAAYLQPQEVWWAFDPDTASWRGAARDEREHITRALDPVRIPAPIPAPGRSRKSDKTRPSAVLLLDEIDKADPDVPNDLLEMLDVGRFHVDEVDQPLTVTADTRQVLLMLTSNGERELPPAFLRRCVVLNLEDPSEDWLVTVANDRFGRKDATFHRSIAAQVMELRKVARARDLREPSTAEYLDAVEACRRLKITTTSKTWELVSNALLSKQQADTSSQ
jgi:MoxR-like ATPase